MVVRSVDLMTLKQSRSQGLFSGLGAGREKIYVTASFSSSTENTKQVAALEYIVAKPAN